MIGGGPTGVELAGELAIIAHNTMKGHFTRIQPAKARVILLDAGERVTAAFSEKLSAKVAGVPGRARGDGAPGRARHRDRRAGGDVPDRRREERIDARTVVWAAGVQAVGFAKTLAEATGAQTDRAGRVQIGPT